ncbi:zinc finger protein PLAGL2 [Gadus morhua]|uniref:Zinc finger protein PLAGL2-like n=1 Tax=Gadus morhua TaxID=8049 RepID=A0A8C5BDU1_GADMO|nr:zinc finger protein PLAGL2-like [Gadus morhua]
MFQQQDHLKSQLQEAHAAHRQLFQCQECGKQYNTQLGYRRHLVAAHGTTATGLPCHDGPPPSLLEHPGGHDDRPAPPQGPAGAGAAALPVRERKYSCERCDRRFYTRKDVRRHAVVHTGRRDFLCPRCAQRFGRRDHLTRHLKKSHAQEAGLTAGGGMAGGHPAAAPSPSSGLCAVKEEPSPVTCDGGSAPKEPPESPFSMDMYSSYPMASPGMGHHHHHGLLQSSLSSAMGRHMAPSPSPHGHHHPAPGAPQQPPGAAQQQPPAQQQAYGAMPRYQHGATSYPRVDMESFLLDLQSGLPPNHLSTAPPSSSSSASPPHRDGLLSEGAGGGGGELSCAANMDLGPLLGFLPFGLPPYGAHMGMGGLMMGYPSGSAANASSSSSSGAGLSPQPPGPFALIQPPQAHVPQGPGAHSHSQLPQGYSSPAMSTSSPLPRYYQAFQQ